MELQTLAVAGPLIERCCSCPCCSRTSGWRRCVKRKLDRAEDDAIWTPAFVAEDAGDEGFARVEVENEVAALREAVASQQVAIQELYAELDEERNASASATSEAMSMILRLQREKAEVQMEARQFKRFAEEQMSHDQEELAALDEFILKRDEAIQSLSFQLQAYRHQLLSYVADTDAAPHIAESVPCPPEIGVANDGEHRRTSQFDDVPIYEYPPLKCAAPEFDDHGHAEAYIDLDKYAFEDKPRDEEKVEGSEARLFHLEETTIPTGNRPLEKDVFQQSSQVEFKNHEEHPVMVDRASLDDDEGFDGTSDRVYTIDAVHGAPTVGESGDSTFTLEEKEKRRQFTQGNGVQENVDIKRLYIRLQALEEDRESIRQAIVSMRTEKAQLVLLKEMTQQLQKEVVPERRSVTKKKAPLSMSSFSIVVFPVVKWIMSFLLWKRKVTQSKYTFGVSNNNVGLLVLLDKTPLMTYRKTPTRNTIMTATSN